MHETTSYFQMSSLVSINWHSCQYSMVHHRYWTSFLFLIISVKSSIKCKANLRTWYAEIIFSITTHGQHVTHPLSPLMKNAVIEQNLVQLILRHIRVHVVMLTNLCATTHCHISDHISARLYAMCCTTRADVMYV